MAPGTERVGEVGLSEEPLLFGATLRKCAVGTALVPRDRARALGTSGTRVTSGEPGFSGPSSLRLAEVDGTAGLC